MLLAQSLVVLLFSLSQAAAESGPATTMKGYVAVNGAKLYYEVTGQGPALVLIHSGLADRRMWDDQVDAFASRYQVIRYDVRGFGNSDSPTKEFSPSDDLYQLLDLLGIEKVSVLGLSMGGYIALDFAVEHPARVQALIPVAAGLSGFDYSPDLQQRISAIFAAGKDSGPSCVVEMWLADPMLAALREDPDALARVRALLEENVDGFLRTQLASSANPPAAQRLSRIGAPTLIVVGDRDEPEILRTAEALEVGIPNARKAVMQGAGHMVNLEKPSEFNRLVLDFLNGVHKR